MATTNAFETKSLDHLGLVAGMCDQLGIVELIDQLMPQRRDQQHLSNGQCVKALILNGLGFYERRLYLVSDFFQDKPLDVLLRPDISPEMLNDDRLGRCLDDLHAFGVSTLYSSLAAQACQVLGLDQQARYAHLDTTSFHLDGRFNSDTPPDEASAVVHITPGYSRDHHPNLNQVVQALMSEQQAGLPLMTQSLSGNADDKSHLASLVEGHLARLQSDDQAPVYWVADSALYSKANLQRLSPQVRWITRVPETLTAARELIESIDTQEMARDQATGYLYYQVGNRYGGVAQQWVLYRSPQAEARELKQLTKRFSKGSGVEYRRWEKLKKERFSCPEDAQKAHQALAAKLSYSCLVGVEVIPITGYPGRGKPRKDAQPQILGYRLNGEMVCSQRDWKQARRYLGRFILATNAVQDGFEPAGLLNAYKGQQHVERGFRFMKDKQFMASTAFVKKPERLEAILMIMTLCLMVYSAAEYQLKQHMEAQDQTLPNQKGQEEKKVSLRWVFVLLRGIHCLYGWPPSGASPPSRQPILLNVKPVHQRIVALFGSHIKKYYPLN